MFKLNLSLYRLQQQTTRKSLFKTINKFQHQQYSSASSVNAFADKKFIIINQKNNHQQLKYPILWLRDNCQCNECYHPGSNSRTVDWSKFDINIQPYKIEYENSELKITWSDQHKSIHGIQWLLARKFTPENCQQHLNTIYRPIKKYWNSKEFSTACKTFQFNDLINSDSGLYNWLYALTVNGVAIIEGTPATEAECRRLADRVGFIRKTHYGEEFIVRAKEGTSNVAYLSTPLQLHTDLPYYEYKPGVNLLHCLVQSQSSGAFNLLSDGFYVASKMKIEYPDFYEILTNTLVDWNDIGNEDGNEFYSLYRAPVISLDREEKLQRINHSVPQRDSHFSIPLDVVDDWYRAHAKFVELIHQESVSFKTKPGDILTFDNTRLVHGRTGYTDIDGNHRYLVGAYLDWDEIYSKLRVLMIKQK